MINGFILPFMVLFDFEDIIICNHILEHVPDYQRALCELYRIFKNDCLLILSVPIWSNLKEHYENHSILNKQERIEHFGQADHFRVFADNFIQDIVNAGFNVSTVHGRDMPKRIRAVLGPANYDVPWVYFCTK